MSFSTSYFSPPCGAASSLTQVTTYASSQLINNSCFEEDLSHSDVFVELFCKPVSVGLKADWDILEAAVKASSWLLLRRVRNVAKRATWTPVGACSPSAGSPGWGCPKHPVTPVTSLKMCTGCSTKCISVLTSCRPCPFTVYAKKHSLSIGYYTSLFSIDFKHPFIFRVQPALGKKGKHNKSQHIPRVKTELSTQILK